MDKILKTLTGKFNYVVVSIKESNDIDKLTIDELQNNSSSTREDLEVEDDKEREEGKTSIKPRLNISNRRGKFNSLEFNEFGHLHIPNVKRTQVEDKSVRCVLLGVSDE
ncbi:hypothetical protein CR513_59220, partial [Mucuna pruriens]